jgi:hypothetical protein
MKLTLTSQVARSAGAAAVGGAGGLRRAALSCCESGAIALP